MPYLVTVKRPGCGWGEKCPTAHPPAASTRAVATLEEARRVIDGCCVDFDGDEITEDLIDRMPESGGTVGPLPDGTTIQVERVGWPEIWLKVGDGLSNAQALAAWNARHDSALHANASTPGAGVSSRWETHDGPTCAGLARGEVIDAFNARHASGQSQQANA